MHIFIEFTIFSSILQGKPPLQSTSNLPILQIHNLSKSCDSCQHKFSDHEEQDCSPHEAGLLDHDNHHKGQVKCIEVTTPHLQPPRSEILKYRRRSELELLVGSPHHHHRRGPGSLRCASEDCGRPFHRNITSSTSSSPSELPPTSAPPIIHRSPPLIPDWPLHQAPSRRLLKLPSEHRSPSIPIVTGSGNSAQDFAEPPRFRHRRVRCAPPSRFSDSPEAAPIPRLCRADDSNPPSVPEEAQSSATSPPPDDEEPCSNMSVVDLYRHQSYRSVSPSIYAVIDLPRLQCDQPSGTKQPLYIYRELTYSITNKILEE